MPVNYRIKKLYREKPKVGNKFTIKKLYNSKQAKTVAKAMKKPRNRKIYMMGVAAGLAAAGYGYSKLEK